MKFGDWYEADGERYFVIRTAGPIIYSLKRDCCCIHAHDTDYRQDLRQLPRCEGWDWKEITIREGAWYKSRDGYTYGPLRKFDREPFSWAVKASSENCWRGNGAATIGNSLDKRDLVEEVKPPIQIREGAYYKRRDLSIVGPAKPHPGARYKWQVEGFTYTDSGFRFASGDPATEDLIEEASPPYREPKPGEKCDMSQDGVDWSIGNHTLIGKTSKGSFAIEAASGVVSIWAFARTKFTP